MKNIFLTVLFLGFSLVLLTPVQASNDHVEARLLRDSGEIMPLESILIKLKKEVSGTVIEVELEMKNQQIVYEIEILQHQGIVKEVYIDARTGDILSIKDDD